MIPHPMFLFDCSDEEYKYPSSSQKSVLSSALFFVHLCATFSSSQVRNVLSSQAILNLLAFSGRSSVRVATGNGVACNFMARLGPVILNSHVCDDRR